MNLSIFQSDKGDCLLVESKDHKLMLVDGGMRSSYKVHVAPYLARLQQQKRELDIAYVSHIDDDHISGVLQLMDDLVAWRVYDYQQQNGNAMYKKPVVGRPPTVKTVWHNAFHEQVEDNTGKIERMLAASAAILSSADRPELRNVAAASQDLITSKKQAIQLSRRISPEQLKIKLNPEYNGKLMMVKNGMPAQISLGSISILVLAPFEADLRTLRNEWNQWLEENEKALAEVERKAREDTRRLGNDLERLIAPMLAQASAFGNRKSVTPPNLASLMLLLEENGKSVLLTGDGHADDILKGLECHGKVNAGERIHVNVLKVQHHGSEHNITEDFCKRVTADDYIFCGNGFATNPELGVVELIVQSRLQDDTEEKFNLWFNCHASIVEHDNYKDHMTKLEQKVKKLKADCADRMEYKFLKQSSFDLTV